MFALFIVVIGSLVGTKLYKDRAKLDRERAWEPFKDQMRIWESRRLRDKIKARIKYDKKYKEFKTNYPKGKTKYDD